MNQQKINEIIEKGFKDRIHPLDKNDEIFLRYNLKKTLSHPDILWKEDVLKMIDDLNSSYIDNWLSPSEILANIRKELKQKIGGGE